MVWDKKTGVFAGDLLHVALCWAEGDTTLDVSSACLDQTDNRQRPELFSMWILQFGTQLVRSCIFTDVKNLMIYDDDDDAEMRNVKLSIITAAMIFDVWCCF